MWRLIGDSSIPFMALRRYGYAVSALLILLGIAAMGNHARNSGSILNFGIDFAGGTIVQLKFSETPDVDRVRGSLEATGLKSPSIQRFGKIEDREILVRVAEETEAARDIDAIIRRAMYVPEELAALERGLQDFNNAGQAELAETLARADGDADLAERTVAFRAVAKAIVKYRTEHDSVVRDFAQLEGLEGFSPHIRELLEKSFFLSRFAVLRVESVGPAVGRDLKWTAFWAVIWAIGGILVYIWLRFELRFGVAAVICLGHDVLVTVGAFALTNREVDLPVIAALLTLVGYSLNDTIVVFDRIRDNLKLMRREPLAKIIDDSINQTLSRTLLTSGTTLFVVVALFLVGGPVINGFAFALLVGVVVGTYSSIFVASALLLEMALVRPAARAN